MIFFPPLKTPPHAMLQIAFETTYCILKNFASTVRNKCTELAKAIGRKAEHIQRNKGTDCTHPYISQMLANQ